MTNLYKIGQWYKHHGLVGEEKLALVQTIVAIAGKPIGFGLIAASGCVDADTEFLTPTGWKKISEYDNDLVAQYSDGNVEFVEPGRYIKAKETEFIHFKTKYGVNQKLSSEHRVVYVNGDKLHELSAGEVATAQVSSKCGFRGKFITTFNKSCGLDNGFNDDELRLQVAISADAHIHQDGFIRFRLKKEHKKERLRILLNSVGCRWREQDCATQAGFTNFYVHWDKAFKIFPREYYGLMTPQLKVIADESLFWDGNNKKCYFTSEKENADFIQFAFSASGKRATIYSYYRERSGKYEYTVMVTDRTLVGMCSKSAVNVIPSPDGYKYCFTVPSGMLVLRCEGRIFVTGNSGKTATMDLLVGDPNNDIPSLINKKHVYFKDAASATAQWYEADQIKNKKLFVLKELQKDKSHDAVEMIKSMTEGKSARRKVTNMAKGTVDEQIIRPMPVLFTYAIENNSANPDAELQRRCITMCTDISKQQTGEVLKVKSKLRWDVESTKCLTPEEEQAIKLDINAIFESNFGVLNPFAEYFAESIANIAPDQKVRSMMEHFWDVMDGVVKINAASDPLFVLKGEKPYYIANIQDLFQTIDIYKDSFLRDVYSVPPMGDIVLAGFRDATTVKKTTKIPKEMRGNASLGAYVSDLEIPDDWFEVQHIKKAVKEKQDIVLSTKVVRDICYQLVDAGYLEIDKNEKVHQFRMVDEMHEFMSPNAQELYQFAYKLVAEKYPQKVAEWSKRQFAPYQHPVTGESVSVLEDELDMGDLN